MPAAASLVQRSGLDGGRRLTVRLRAVPTWRSASSSGRAVGMVGTVGTVTVVAALVGCGSGLHDRSASGSTSALSSPALSSPPPSSSLPAFSSRSPTPSGASSLTAPASSPVASWPNPAASNFSAPPAASVPSVGLMYVDHGVALVGVSPIGGGYQSNQPSTLWLSTDLTHWRDVTPPASRQPFEGNLYVTFDQASFLSPTTGWVTTWNGWNLGVTIYRTANGGKSWTTALAGSGHGDHAGDADWIQLLSPTVAFDENIEATASNMSLLVTTNAGTSWRTVYTGPPAAATPTPSAYEAPMLFVSQRRGFAATAIPPAEGQIDQGFFETTDGGVSWTVVRPPVAPSTTTCPSDNLETVECLFALPSFSDATHAVLASEVVDGAHATVGFDVTSDGGSSWRLTTAVDVPIPLVPADSYPKSYALVSTPSSRNWWIVSPNAHGVTTRISSDAGQHWSVADSSDVLGAPYQLEALDATHALLLTDLITSEGATGALYVTSDSGRSWETLFGS
jgi:photosystem II stability/assembly factor-like uncharacterized protein